MYIIAGLGNPGTKYEKTRHNAGFEVIDALSEKYNIPLSESKHKAIYGRGMIGSAKVMLVKPQTFMNLSGESIGELARYYEVDPEEEIIVISDDIALEPGMIRIRKKGSAGGHNGLKNIIAHLGTQDFKRIRIGVGANEDDLISHVLGRLPESDRKAFEEAVDHAVCAVTMILDGDTDGAMNKYNTKQKCDE